MTDRPARRRLSEIARRWHALAERRRSDLADLYRSGRWQRYCSDMQRQIRLQQAASLCERWAQIVAALDAAAPNSGPVRRDVA